MKNWEVNVKNRRKTKSDKIEKLKEKKRERTRESENGTQKHSNTCLIWSLLSVRKKEVGEAIQWKKWTRGKCKETELTNTKEKCTNRKKRGAHQWKNKNENMKKMSLKWGGGKMKNKLKKHRKLEKEQQSKTTTTTTTETEKMKGKTGKRNPEKKGPTTCLVFDHAQDIVGFVWISFNKFRKWLFLWNERHEEVKTKNKHEKMKMVFSFLELLLVVPYDKFCI